MSDAVGAAGMGQVKPCQPSKVLFTAFVPRKSLENDGNKGDLRLLVGNNHMPVMVAGAGQAALPSRLCQSGQLCFRAVYSRW